MAWTTPRTWVTDEPVLLSYLHTEVRDNIGFLYRRAFVNLTLGVRQKIESLAWQAIDFEEATVVSNDFGIWDPDGATERFTASQDGRWFCAVRLNYGEASVADIIGLRLRVDGQDNHLNQLVQSRPTTNTSQEAVHAVSDVIDLLEGQYIEFQAFHDLDDELDIIEANVTVRFVGTL
jgi:hypothetical protein